MIESIDVLGSNLIKISLLVAGFVVGLVALYVAVKYVLKMVIRFQTDPNRLIAIEIIPDLNDNKDLSAAKEFYSILHELLTSKTMIGKVFSLNDFLSLEIVANKEDGIKYNLVSPEHLESAITGAIATYMPTAKWKVGRPDATYEPHGRYQSYKQSGYFAFPLRKLENWQQSDTAGYLAGALTKLEFNEKIILQFVIEPKEIREAKILRNKLIHNEALITSLGQKSLPTGIVGTGVSGILFNFIDAIGNLFHGPSKIYSPEFQSNVRKRDVSARLKPARSLSSIEQELSNSVHEKISEALFGVSIRTLICADDTKSRQKSLSAALNVLSRPKLQSFKLRRFIITPILAKRFQKRLPTLYARGASILSVSELASLFNFNHASKSQTEDLVKSLSRQLPAPLSLKQNDSPDVIIGKNVYQSRETMIGLTAAERERHMYIIGGTGNGKTTMLEYSIVQDIRNGKGLAVVDPHGDLSEKLLGYIPEDRIKDVIYFNPDDLDYPIGINLLELTPGLSGKELLREKDIITESVISVFRKIFSEEDTGGHRIEYVLRNAIQTALTVPDATLFTVFDLLNDPKYLKNVIAKLEDKNLKNFWKHELGKAGDMQKVKMSAGITAKIGRFLFSASAKQILEQPKSTINFDEILDSKKILICNLSKGLLGEDTSELFGITLLAKIQLASLRRVRHAQSERTPYYLYVDEFQNFATMSFVQMLSESRKYKLFLTMAEQSTSQQSDKDMVNIILANVGTVVCFRTGNPADEQVLLPLFKPFINEGEIKNLPTYNFYIRMAAVTSQAPCSGVTILIKEAFSHEIAQLVVVKSRKTFSQQYNSNIAVISTHDVANDNAQESAIALIDD